MSNVCVRSRVVAGWFRVGVSACVALTCSVGFVSFANIVLVFGLVILSYFTIVAEFVFVSSFDRSSLFQYRVRSRCCVRLVSISCSIPFTLPFSISFPFSSAMSRSCDLSICC